jgi:arylsulfatase A-like enzyme
VLRLHGYRIELILGGDHTHFYGLRKAYGAVDNYFDGSMVAGRNVNDDELVLERVKALPPWDGKPVLLQFHLMSAHLLGMRDPKFARFQPARPYVPWRKGAAADLSKPQIETGNHYDNGVLQLDDVLRRLIGSLAERQYMNDTVVVLTGDHGEALGEHGEYGHAKSVFEPAMHVPLVFAGFGGPPPQVADSGAALASQIDIAPTLLRFMDAPVPRTWAGMPLQNKLALRQLAFQQGFFVGLYDGTRPGHTLKYWRHLNTGEERVFDIDADPAEAHDLLPSLESPRLAALRWAAKPIGASVPR